MYDTLNKLHRGLHDLIFTEQQVKMSGAATAETSEARRNAVPASLRGFVDNG